MLGIIMEFLVIAFGPRIDYEKSLQWKEEEEWYYSFSPVQGNEYAGIKDFAEKKYDEIRQVYQGVDQKAEWCFGLAVAAAGASLAFSDKLGLDFWNITPAFIAFALSMHLSLRAKMPVDRPSPMTVRGAIEREENTQNRDAWIAASLHCATSGVKIVNGWKAKSLQYAAQMLIIGVLCLFVTTAAKSYYSPVPSGQNPAASKTP